MILLYCFNEIVFLLLFLTTMMCGVDKVIEVTLRRCSGGYTVVEGVACAMEGEKGWRL